MDPGYFPMLVERLKEEHVQMREQLSEIRTMAASLYSLEDCSIGMCKLIELQDLILSLVEELEQHSEWEEKVLFPLLQSYLHPTTALSVSRSMTVLEQDHDLAKRVVQAFVDGVNAMKVPIDDGLCTCDGIGAVDGLLNTAQTFHLGRGACVSAHRSHRGTISQST